MTTQPSPSEVSRYWADVVDTGKYKACIQHVKNSLFGNCREPANFKDIYQEAWFIYLKRKVKERNIEIDSWYCKSLAKTARFLCFRMRRGQAHIHLGEADKYDESLEDELSSINPLLELYSETFDKMMIRYGLKKLDNPLNQQTALHLVEFKALLNQMEDKDWRIVWLKYYCGYSYKEIAVILDITEGYVETRLHRSREKIAQKFSKTN